jgi:hypothetical protein
MIFLFLLGNNIGEQGEILLLDFVNKTDSIHHVYWEPVSLDRTDQIRDKLDKNRNLSQGH